MLSSVMLLLLFQVTYVFGQCRCAACIKRANGGDSRAEDLREILVSLVTFF